MASPLSFPQHADTSIGETRSAVHGLHGAVPPKNVLSPKDIANSYLKCTCSVSILWNANWNENKVCLPVQHISECGNLQQNAQNGTTAKTITKFWKYMLYLYVQKINALLTGRGEFYRNIIHQPPQQPLKGQDHQMPKNSTSKWINIFTNVIKIEMQY